MPVVAEVAVVEGADLIIFNRKLSTQFLPPGPASSDLQDLLTTKARLYRENERLEKLIGGNHLYSRRTLYFTQITDITEHSGGNKIVSLN